MNLVDQIFEQAKLGTAVDPSANPFATGVQLGQNQQRINAEKQRLALEIAQAPLHQTLLQQEAAMNQAKLNSFLEDRQVEASAGLAFAALQSRVNPLLAEGKIDEAQNVMLQAGDENAFLLADPKKRLHSLFDMSTRAQDARLALVNARNAGKNLDFKPGFGVEVDPLTGVEKSYWRQSPNAAILTKDPQEDLPPEVKASRYLAEKRAQLRGLENQLLETGVGEDSPDTAKLREKIQSTRDEVDALQARHGIEETTVIDTPGGEHFELRKGPIKAPNAITPAETTKYGEDLTATSNALRSVLRLKGQLGSNVVGLSPKVQSVIFDEVLAQFDPSLADKARAAGRQNIRLATQQILGELNNRGRLSNLELQAVKAAMPSLGGAESSPNAQVKLDELSLMLAEKGAAAAQSLKRPVTPEILQSLSDLFPPGTGEKAMAEEVKKGALSRETALQVRKWQKMKGL